MLSAPPPSHSIDPPTGAVEGQHREQELLLRRAFEDAPIGMALTSLTGQWLRVNQALCEIVGYTESELLATTFQAITHPDDLAQTLEITRQLLAGECVRGQHETRYLDRLGRGVWVSVTVSLVRDDEGRPRMHLAQIQDVTERVRATEALRESEALLRATQEIANVGSWARDCQRGTVTWSEELYRICGIEPSAEVSYELYLSLIHPDDHDRIAAALETAVKQGGRFSFDHRIIRPDGSVRHLHGRGRVVMGENGVARRMVGSSQDVTERRLAEELETQQTETLQAIFDHIPAMITFTDAWGRPVFANREWRRVSGWTLEEGRSKDFFAELFLSAEERDRMSEFRRAASGSLGDFQMRTRDGRALDTTWACVALSNGSVVGIGQDVTDRRRLESQLRQAQKLEAIGRLAGGVAHDFNNLLTIIQNYGRFVADELSPGSEALADMGEVLKASDRAAELTRQLLAFSRQQLLQPRLVDVNRTVANVAGMLRRLIGENIHLETDLAPDIWPVLADPGQLEQVLLNLAVNARDAMPDGGTLYLRTASAEIDAAAARLRPGLVPGRYASLVVEDSGVGIAPDVLPQIFEPFFTTKDTGKGTGLGLATAYGIVKQSGGYIYVDSVSGGGSRFTVLLPCFDDRGADGLPEATATPRGGTETILLVEDEAPVRAVVRRMLESLGYKVREAANGAEALGILDTSLRRIDLILTDVVMPDIHGRHLAECAMADDPGRRVLYMTGYTDDNILRQELTPGTALLQKPFTTEALGRAVRDMLDDR
jgi:two-component system cell cycle sensor histidine kinase/response regulator CckA